MKRCLFPASSFGWIAAAWLALLSGLHAQLPVQSTEAHRIEGETVIEWFGYQGRTYFIQVSDASDPLREWTWAPVIEAGNDGLISYEFGSDAPRGFARLQYTDAVPPSGVSLGFWDADGDGMPNGWEIENGFNPLNPTGNDGSEGDLDGDGLTSGEEYQNDTNPWDEDSDNDGITDGGEVDQGYDPNNSSNTPEAEWFILVGDLEEDQPMARNRTIVMVGFLPIKFEITHIEKERDQDGVELETAVNPGANALLRDEIADLKITVPTFLGTDWDLTVDLEPEDIKFETLGDRGSVQMYDFGRIDGTNVIPLSLTADDPETVGVNEGGNHRDGPYDIKLLQAKGGIETFKVIVNKSGCFKVRVKSADEKIDVASQEISVANRIRKYANLASHSTHDLNQHDQAFVNAADHWGAVYQHQVDSVDRLKAIGMTESELGITDATDIMTIGNAGDHVLDTFKNVPPYDKFPSAGKALREVDVANGSTRMLSYPTANETPAPTAIHWGVCWLYQKASSIQKNPNPPQPPAPPNPYIPGPWRSWDTAVEKYGPPSAYPDGLYYLDRVRRPYTEGRHPSIPTLYIWPLLSDRKARAI